MEVQRVSIQAGLGNLSLIMNPLHRPPGFQVVPISDPPPMSAVQYPRRGPAVAFPNRPPPGYPPPGYPPPGYHPPSYPTPRHHTPGHPTPGHPTPGHAHAVTTPAPTMTVPATPAPTAPTYAAPTYPTSPYPPPAPTVTASAISAAPAPAIPAAPARPPPIRPYIRPVIKEDAEEVAEIINYYNASSPFDPEYEAIEPEHVLNFIETCKRRKLPFLGLVKPSDSSQTSQGPPKSQICGISYVDVFGEDIIERSHGDLRVYIRPGMTRHGYGTLLMDHILSVCDKHYRRRFQTEWRPVGDVQLDVSRLKELVCDIHYPAQLEMKYMFIWQWLKNTFGFKFFGEMRQDRAKYGYK